MEKPKSKIKNIYGYAVCLVAIITFLFNATSLIRAVIDLQDPLYAHGYRHNEPSLASYDNYKMDVLSSDKVDEKSGGANYTPDDQTLQRMFESAKNDKIKRAKHDGFQTIVVSSIAIVLCIIFFVTHWMWMRKLARNDG